MLQDDAQIRNQLLDKDEKALEFLIEKYHKLLWLIVQNTLRGIGSAEDVEECISDVFSRFWRKPEAFDPNRGTMKTYLCVMAKSMAINQYKKLAKQYGIEVGQNAGETSESAATEDTLTHICREESAAELFDAISELTKPDSEILFRRYYLGEKTSAIALQLGLQTKEVENRLYRGKNKLKSILQNRGLTI
jgi:RNA polymerase sigma-70 factor (ECF subfamily)